MRKLVLFVITSVCILTNSSGQKIDIRSNTNTSSYSIADIDGDQRLDTLRFDAKMDSIMVSLSTLQFKSFGLKHQINHDTEWISAIDGGFNYCFSNEERKERSEYIYDAKTKAFRMQLLECSYSDKNGYTNYSLNLANEEYKALFGRYNALVDSIEPFTNIFIKIENDAIYWGNEDKLHLPQEDFFNEYRANYPIPEPDTITFIGIDKNYDVYQLIGEDQNHNYIYSILSIDDSDINRGDTLFVSYALYCSQEAGDGDVFYARTSIEEAIKIADGRLSKFYKTNKKKINYIEFGEEPRIAIDYFLANTKDKAILEALKSPGQFNISKTYLEEKLQGYDYEGDLLIEIKDTTRTGKEILVSRIIISESQTLYDGYTTYYIWDAKVDQYKEWVLEDK